MANVCNFYIEYYLLSDRVADLIRIAAVAHDYGYIFDPKEHEERSIVEVRPMLTEYSDKEIAVIEGLIRATKVPQKPQNLYEQILSDADLDYLGREDYPELSEGLYQEFLYFGVVENQADWLDVQIRFLESHQFQTDWAKNNRTENKQKVIDGLKAKGLCVRKVCQESFLEYKYTGDNCHYRHKHRDKTIGQVPHGFVNIH